MSILRLNLTRLVKKNNIVIYGATIIFISLILIFLISNSAKPKNLNVLLITMDALRPDHLSCYGYKRNTSPNIDTLAKEGILFTQAISQSSWTPPSIYSILTSMYPHEHGVTDFGVSLKHNIQTLPEILKDNGYYVGLISGRGNLTEFHFSDLINNFDTFYPLSPDYISAEEISNNTIKWLRFNKEKKFFLWLFYLEPHTPYKPPLPYNKLYVNDEFMKEDDKYIPIADKSRERYDGFKVIPRIAAVKGMTNINYYISQYDGEIRFADEQIGRVLEELKKLKLFNNTLIIISSDHGEYMGEHDLYFVHGNHLHDAVIKVPLIFKCDTIFLKGKIINQQVASIDIMPTILDILCIKKSKLSGSSLLPFILKGKNDSSRAAFSEYLGSASKAKSTQISLRKAGWKLTYKLSDRKYELYNLNKDPGELINVTNIEKEKFKFMKEILDNHMKNQEWMKNTTLNQTLDEQSKEKLRSLGYVQ